MEYKKTFLEDIWDADTTIDSQTKDIIWNTSKVLKLTLERKIKILETREVYNPLFSSLSFSEKLSKFQNMWKPDHASFTFFSCMHHHLKTKKQPM